MIDATVATYYWSQSPDDLKLVLQSRSEVPYDFVRKRMSVVVAGADAHHPEPLLITKGALDNVLGSAHTCGMVGMRHR